MAVRVGNEEGGDRGHYAARIRVVWFALGHVDAKRNVPEATGPKDRFNGQYLLETLWCESKNRRPMAHFPKVRTALLNPGFCSMDLRIRIAVQTTVLERDEPFVCQATSPI